jgi:hypothetical protein
VKWKLRLFGHASVDEEDTVDLSAKKAEARQALESSERALRAAKSRNPEVNRLARSLREIREANHFAEKIQESFRSAAP